MPSYRTHLHDPAGDSKPSATDTAYRILRDEILSCEIAPGTRVVEGEIASRLDMSKTPVKKALGMLVHEGFVELRPRHGYRVTEITLADVQEVYQLRQILEPAAAELAASNATPEQLQSLRSLVEADPEDSHEDRVAKVLRFHEVLAAASGNARLAASLISLLDEMQRLMSIGLDIEESVALHVREHKELLDALLKGNHHTARQIAEQQVETGRMRMFDAILASLTAGGGVEPVVLHPRPSRPQT